VHEFMSLVLFVQMVDTVLTKPERQVK